MDDLQYCSGDCNGTPCRCRRYILHVDAKCSCGHPEGYHPVTVVKATAASIVAAYQTPSQILKAPAEANPAPSSNPTPSSSKLPSTSSLAAAVKETKTPMKRSVATTEEMRSLFQHQQKKKDAGKQLVLGQIMLLVTQSGLQLIVFQLRHNKPTWTTPRNDTIATLEAQGLAVNGLRDKLAFGEGFEAAEMDGFFRENFPQFFEYMDATYPLDPTAVIPLWHWRLLIRTNSTLTLSPKLNPDATEFKRYFGHSATKAADRKIYLASSHRVPESVYDTDDGVWVLKNTPESDTYSEEEDSNPSSWHGSDSDSALRRRRPSSKALGKAKAKSPSPTRSIFSIDSRSENDDFPFPDTLAPTAPPAPVVVVAPSTASSTTAPLPTLTTGFAQPSSPGRKTRTNRYSVYSTYSTTPKAKPFMQWDFEVDPLFWNRRHDDV
ncbi:hypothetical protein C8R46DRAFT_1031596 [Mycena filopes]|nr:hypothetical protein C8R46DRAFT_1031596 [Mycena filopes]